MSGLVPGKNKSRPELVEGFTFIELIVAIAILGVMAAIILPNLRPPSYERKKIVSNLNALMQTAVHNALVTGKLQKIIFDLDKRKIYIEEATNRKNERGEIIFEPFKSSYITSTYSWPENYFEFSNFYIGKRDEITSTLRGAQEGKIWFFITPEGLSQPVIINIYNLKEARPEQPKGFELSLVLNPFTAQFKDYYEFQKPE